MNLPLTITGIVVKGQQRGRLLGFPTANINPDKLDINKIEAGVFSSTIKIDDKTFKAATSVGAVSTFDQTYPTIEAYILDFSGDIYGKTVELVLTHKIRDMQKFDSIEALVAQIKDDVEKVYLT
jgi:riboflavin kinase/FMN adenylyltransferase